MQKEKVERALCQYLYHGSSCRLGEQPPTPPTQQFPSSLSHKLRLGMHGLTTASGFIINILLQVQIPMKSDSPGKREGQGLVVSLR